MKLHQAKMAEMVSAIFLFLSVSIPQVSTLITSCWISFSTMF